MDKPPITYDPDPETRERLRVVCRALRTSYVDFTEFAIHQALDYCEGLAREQQAIRDYYEGNR